MTLGPLFRREFLAPRRGRRAFPRRAAEALLVGGLGLLIYWLGFIQLAESFGTRSLPPEGRQLWLGRTLFLTTFVVEGFLLVFRVADAAGTAVAEERDRDTLPWLILTRLTALEIVATKATARGLAGSALTLVGLPVLIGSAALAGLEAELLLALAMLAATAGFAAALAVLAGVGAAPVAAAKARAGLAVMGWLLAAPLLSFLPVSTGTIWGDLLAEIKLVAGLVAPLSPVSLLTDPGWFFRPTVDRLEVRVAVMVAAQAVVGVVALGLAASRLHPTDRPAGRGDPARGGRARCGADPILWREYELPASQRRWGPLIALRQLALLVRALVLNLLAILATALGLAIPAAIVLATVYYGSAAFREAWQVPLTTTPLRNHVARDQFNGLIRTFTALILFFPILGLPGTLVGRFALERDRKTWDDFLMTPLDGREILRSKARVAWRGFRAPAAWAAAVWAVGIASGSVAPLGAALAAGDLALMLALQIALGLNWGVRALAKDAITNRALLASVGLVGFHAPLLVLLSLPPHALLRVGEWSPHALLTLGLLGPVVALATLALARRTYRRTIARFDEWVGRPRRTSQSAPASPAVASQAGPASRGAGAVRS